MRASSAFIRLFIRGIAWDASANGDTFATALQALAQPQFKETFRGKVLVRARANGTEAHYSLPNHDGLSSKDISEAISFVLDKVDELNAANPGGLSDDALIVALLAAFPTIRSYAPDFSNPGFR